jgi:hypothetical protein
VAVVDIVAVVDTRAVVVDIVAVVVDTGVVAVVDTGAVAVDIVAVAVDIVAVADIGVVEVAVHIEVAALVDIELVVVADDIVEDIALQLVDWQGSTVLLHIGSDVLESVSVGLVVAVVEGRLIQTFGMQHFEYRR